MKSIWLGCLLLTILAGPAHAEASAEGFIRSIYDAHRPWAGHTINRTTRQSLEKYFDAELTTLFLKDDECQGRSQGICNLDHDPFLCAQDYADEGLRDLRIKDTGQNKYQVSFENLGTTTLLYQLRKTENGWRVQDITCEGFSLKKQLTGPTK